MQKETKKRKIPFWLILIGMIVLSYLFSYFIHWIGIFIVSGLLSYFFFKRGVKSVVAGFLAGFFLWFGVSFFSDLANGHHLTPKVAELLKLPNSVAFMLVTGLMGGFLGMIGAWFGSSLRNLFQK